MSPKKKAKVRRASSWLPKVRKAGAALAVAFAFPKIPSFPSLPSFKFRKGKGSSAPSSRSKAPSQGAKRPKTGKLAGPGAALALVGLGLGWKAQEAVVHSPQLPGWAQWGPYLLACALFGAGILLASWPGGKPSWTGLRSFFKDKFLSKTPLDPLKPRVEWTAFGIIMAVAVFFRVFRIDSVPSGMFIDQGMEGWAALRILHEGFRPVWEFDVFQNPALLLYQLAAWFLVIPASQGTFYLFFSLLSLATFPLVYWTFREIAGPRLALLGLFVLAVMRWNINFSRNGFPTIQVPFYTFGTLAFLLYGIRSGKKWAFYAAGVFFAGGLYTYQAYKIVPFLVLLFALYEVVTRRKAVMSRWKQILAFCGVFLLLAAPYILHTYRGGIGGREASLSILSKIQQQGSYQPLVDNTVRTAVMFHWRGDGNGRHNLQDHRMLDDVTGVLFFFGLVIALATLWRKPSFYGLLGLLIMTVPCLLSIDPAHANRMLGTTPFIALLCALPLALLWDLLRKLGGKWGEKAALVLLAGPLGFAAWLNFDAYFNKQANSITSWQEYAPQETSIGKAIRQNKGKYDYYLSPRFYNYYSISFLGYGYMDQVKPLLLPSGLISREAVEGRGLYFALEDGRTGVLELLKDLYPGGRAEFLVNPGGNTTNISYFVEPEELEKVRGLKAVFDRSVPGEGRVARFPEGLPPGPYKAELTGNLYLEEPGNQSIVFSGNCQASLWIKGRAVKAGETLRLERGFHPIRIQLEAPSGVKPELKVSAVRQGGAGKPLGPGAFNCLPPPRGLRASYYRSSSPSEEPFLVEYTPVLNFTNGNDFSVQAPYYCRWKGTLLAPKTGTYEFMIRTDNPTELSIDGKSLIRAGGAKTVRTHLEKGAHSIEIIDAKPAAYWPVFTFYWTPPGGMREVVPNSAFGLVP